MNDLLEVSLSNCDIMNLLFKIILSQISLGCTHENFNGEVDCKFLDGHCSCTSVIHMLAFRGFRYDV
ncbi:hypothetical protein DERP_015420 [Dermatophagoides pteronyssinus]|uniref:Uncharacterized protein n=1 Tax=Dermatophagoides pteronyssinus TaxID=6956 RepID=A0ABQ8J1E3_DERPT|nr:hypothetical protein DERP_015420 [Dermatophagoides pteronyssinus]